MHYSSRGQIVTVVILMSILCYHSARAYCSLHSMRVIAKTACESVSRQRRSLDTNNQHPLHNYHVTFVKDHPKRHTLFSELHPRTKIVTGDPPFPEDGFLEIPYKSYLSLNLFNVHAHKKRHHQSHNEILKPEHSQKRLKRHHEEINALNYCCSKPMDRKICDRLICEHY